MKLLNGPPDASIVLNLDFFNCDGQNSRVNNITYLEQKVPTLYTVMSAGSDASNSAIYGVNDNAFVVRLGQVVEIVVNNFDDGAHPIHIHGHNAQLVARTPGVYVPPLKHRNQRKRSGQTASATMGYIGDTSTMPAVPMRRDTWFLAPLGYTVIRFRAQNPGVWLFHCYMEWHVEAGLTATIIEAPSQIQAQQSIPSAAMQQCQVQRIPTAGNEAANTNNYTDLTGANTVAPANPRAALV